MNVCMCMHKFKTQNLSSEINIHVYISHGRSPVPHSTWMCKCLVKKKKEKQAILSDEERGERSLEFHICELFSWFRLKWVSS